MSKYPCEGRIERPGCRANERVEERGPKIVANMKGIYETKDIEDEWLDEVSLA